MFRKQSQTRGNMTGFVNEMLGNIKVVKVFDHGEKAQEEFDQINDDLAYYSLRATFFSSITNPATRFMYSGIYAGVAIAPFVIPYPLIGAADTFTVPRWRSNTHSLEYSLSGVNHP